MATETFEVYAVPSADIYLRIRNADGDWFDFDDSTFKAWVSATEPYLVMTEDTARGGTLQSVYHADVDFADLNATVDIERFVFEACDNATPALTDDPIAEPTQIPIASGREASNDVYSAYAEGCFTTTAGTEIRFIAWLEKNGQFFSISSGSCTITAREQGAGTDLFSVTQGTAAAGKFNLTQSTPGFTDDRVYDVTVAITVDGVTYTTKHGLQVQST